MALLSLPTTTSQSEFLWNGGNKMRLIKALTPLLENAGIIMKQDVSDADTLITETAELFKGPRHLNSQ